MKAINMVRASTVLVGLGLTAFLAAPCRAQQEVAPDIYEAGPVQPAQLQQALARQHKAQAQEFRGNFTLLHQVQCAGKVLAPGNYSLSLDSKGSNRRITLRGKSAVMKIRPRAVAEHAAVDQSTLLLRRTGELRRLNAIYLEQLGLVLYLEPDVTQDMARNPEGAERVPIS
jgi:hypothetical protein